MSACVCECARVVMSSFIIGQLGKLAIRTCIREATGSNLDRETDYNDWYCPGFSSGHSPLSSADAKNGGAIPPLPLSVHGVVFN
jgi:hypothetical protein